jgi:CheY-like chemotaxis protein
MKEKVYMKPMDEPIVLIIEDDEPKLQAVQSFLQETIINARLEIATSLSTAIRLLSTNPITLAVVDMSLPTYDVAKDRTGGQPQGFGGKDILRFIEDETPSTYSVVLTQYEEFPSDHNGGRKDLNELKEELHKKFGSRFLDVIHYSGQLGDWRDALLAALISAGIKTKHENINS